ncbi:uncharacterized protein LOC133832859 [Humulus lupulus]|uniref:uncharacterized protein LOC133832859 n=1 Tax=Humulus lupulus TaxID=3486 RepID=UPI002B411A43|nr:uncharacterized protein LOC133832859 [Humulus lupulus]
MARVMLNSKKLSKRLWAEAIFTACYTINRVFLRPEEIDRFIAETSQTESPVVKTGDVVPSHTESVATKAESVPTSSDRSTKEGKEIITDSIQREPSARIKKNHPSDLILVFSHSRATMVRTRGSGSRSVKAVAGSLTASPSLTKKKALKNCDPSDEDPLEEDPSLDENVSSEEEFDPSEDPPVSPKGKKSVKIPEIRTTSPMGPKVSPGSSGSLFEILVFGVIKNIEDRGWLGSLIGLDGFVPRVVQEFYANLNDDLFDSKSFMFGQVYVRGHWYLFSAAEIAKVLHFPPTVDNVAVEFNKDMVLSELVGQNMVWEPHSVLKVTDLTHYYAVLHKFATTNWIPTTHTSTITFDTSFFLYKVGSGLQVDLATLILDHITALGKAKKKGQYLVFPHLIYKLLDSQKSLRLEYEILTPTTTGADYKLKKEPSPVKATKGIALKAGDADSVTTEIVGVKATLESVQTKVFSLKSCLSTMMSHFAASPSK